MTKYLTEEQFEGVQMRLDARRASLNVPRRVSRQFFTRVPNASIRAVAGRSLAWQKAVIRAGAIATFALLAGCLASVIHYFGWFAAVGAPMVGIFWTIIAGLTGDKGSWWYGAAGLIAGLTLAVFLDRAYAVPLVLFSLSIWIHRGTYHLAQIWLIGLVSSSFAAFNMLVEHIDLEDAELAQEQSEPAGA